MTSRRSRLKAVTNLPVRRKTLTSQGSGNETVDNLTSEVSSCGVKGDENIGLTNSTQPNNVDIQKDVNDVPNKNSGSDSSGTDNCDVGFQNNENSVKEVVNDKIDEPNSSEVLENSNDLNKTCNLFNNKNESGNSFRSSKRFKPNLASPSLRERAWIPPLENSKGSDNSKELNCITISNNNYNSNNNNIVEDGFKCYTVLTSQNVTITPLSEYTITPLTPCSNAFIDANISEVEPPQEYQEVQIYTEIEPTEIYINNEITENGDSVIKSGTLQPVLASLTNCDSENQLKGITYECLNTNFTELKSVSGNYIKKSSIKNGTLNAKNNFCVNDDFGNPVAQLRDSSNTESTVSSGSQAELPSHKQNVSTARRRRSKYNDFTKKLADAKREFQKKYEKTKPDRSTLKMIDLIFYNPASNPMESKGKFDKKDTPAPTSEVINDLLAEENVDEPEAVDQSKSNLSDSCESDSMNKMPVPQVKIGVDGEIILDEKSLIIETTEAKKGREGLQNSIPIFEDREYKVSYYRGKSKKTKDWADFETKRFYKALNTIGPDFTLMQKYFPKRSRLELKNKFKREERLNRNLIDKALNNPSEFDMTQLEKDLAIEREAEQEELELRLTKIMKQAARKPRVKSSFLSREIIETDEDTDDSQLEQLDPNSKGLTESEKNKKEKEFDFVFQKLLMKESGKSVSVLPEISSSSSNAFQFTDHGVT